MGSGLILLVIVGAWLAVLVPMALRSHDSAASLSSVDRFSDAMRVLSRRVPGRDVSRTVLVPRRRVDVVVDTRAAVEVPVSRVPTTPPDPALPSVAPPSAGIRPPRRRPLRPAAGPSLAARRRRTLLVLLALALLTLVLAVLVQPLLFAVHAVVDLLAVAFVVHCRQQTLRRAEASWRARDTRAAAPARVPARAAAAEPGVLPTAEPMTRSARYDTSPRALPALPVRPAAEAAPRPRAARYDAPLPAAAGDAWSPVPVPVPTYVGAPVAPGPRVVDLTQPGRWSDALSGAGAAADAAVEGLGDQGELDEILTRRRTASGW